MLLGFKAEKDFYQIDSFQNQIDSWGMTNKETVKPYSNDYYLSVTDNFFLISNFQPNINSENQVVDHPNELIKVLQEKIGKREVYKAGYETNEELGLKIYFFSSFDDKIKKETYRIF